MTLIALATDLRCSVVDPMNSRFFKLALLATIACFPLTLTFAAETKDEAVETETAEKEKDGKKNTTIVVLNATPEAVHAAALEALASVGCEIKKNKPNQIEGKRPNKVGLAVGSGGEKLLVSIASVGEGKTELKVVTKKTMLGIVGQKRWNEEVAAHVRDAIK